MSLLDEMLDISRKAGDISHHRGYAVITVQRLSAKGATASNRVSSEAALLGWQPVQDRRPCRG